VQLFGLLDDGSKWQDLLECSHEYLSIRWVKQIPYQIIGSMDDSKLYAIVVIELFNQSKEIWSLNMIPARRSRKARKSGM
jgi:hypothetical protein